MDRRRLLLAVMGSLALPRAGRAQRMHRVSVLIHGPQSAMRGRAEALRAGLKAHGYVEGRNLHVTVRWNGGGLDRLDDLAAELLSDKPDVIAAGPVLSAAAV